MHLKTEETSRCNLSLMLDKSHILLRNDSLINLMDRTLLSSSSSELSSFIPVIRPGLNCISGKVVLDVKKTGTELGDGSGIRIKNVKVVLVGNEVVKLKVESEPGAGSAGVGGKDTYKKKMYTTVMGSSYVLKNEEFLLGSAGERERVQIPTANSATPLPLLQCS